MSGIPLSHITGSKDFMELNRAALGDSPSVPMDLSKPLPADTKAERDLQRECEGYLIQRGYKRLTSDNVRMVAYEPFSVWCPHRGYFGHLVESRRNPLMPDLFIFNANNTIPALLCELKVARIYQPGQKEMIELGFWKLCESFEAFVELVQAWEGKP